ncbi:diaminopimelate decarboxylase [Serratia inhibens]|uniref:Diaminopimelate decarboxylase n=1 Tax=Serratia inhibens TaxID=2338073 RepID=A0AA93BX83_9GAMM|nr:diaminopimelate decarboxylase [Serratia inhibens]RJF57693.1 diaminopimelate decarboxylase [Serratia inhibens]
MELCKNIRTFCDDTETPFYIYSETEIENRVTALKDCFREPAYTLLYAMKANSNPQIIKALAASGFGVDACSVEEIRIAALSGVPPENIYYNSDCLTADEIEMAIRAGVNITVGSLDALCMVTGKHPGIGISLRVNSGVGAGHSAKVITNGELSKFGILLSELEEAKAICKTASVVIEGLHSHTGSGEMEVTNYIENARIMAELAKSFSSLKFINFGGGFGYDYVTHCSYDISAIHVALNELRETYDLDLATRFIIEPGRYVVAGAGMLISRVCSVKHTSSRNFIGLDTGHNHFPRCFYYDAWHDIENMSAGQQKKMVYDIAGNLCQSGDIFARQRTLPETEVGDLICIKDTGAYGFSMSSNFNSRVRPAEYLLKKNGEIKVIRRAENFDDIISTCVLD